MRYSEVEKEGVVAGEVVGGGGRRKGPKGKAATKHYYPGTSFLLTFDKIFL